MKTGVDRCRFFDGWITAVAGFGDLVFLRDVGTGKVWRSDLAKAALGCSENLSTWEEVSQQYAPENLKIIEDAHSRALKLGGVHQYRITLQSPAGLVVLDCACEAHQCEGCRRKCCVILGVSSVPARSQDAACESSLLPPQQ